ncbi:MAG: low molecular weight protein-tyrosine-phosphatase [Pseudomonadota bacterium]
MTRTMHILCVCLGNICRSPMAEGAVRKAAADARLDWLVDSAGTGAWHVGNPPDSRGLASAAARGYDNSGQRARQVTAADFTSFDLILAMDASNHANLSRMAPAGATAVIEMLDPEGRDVPDPYYGGPNGFETTLDMIEEAAAALVARHIG